MAEHGPGHEAEEIKEVVWTYAGWAIVLGVCIGAGVFIGYMLWGDAAALRSELSQSTEMVGTLKNERETLKSQLALCTRDKEACQRQQAAGGGGAAAGGGVPAARPGEQPGGAPPAAP